MPSSERSKVIFDANSLRYINTGLGQFSYHLLQELALQGVPDFDLIALVHPDYVSRLPEGVQIEKVTWIRRHSPQWIQKMLFGQSNLWHMSTENTKITGVPNGIPVILTIHGLHFLDEEDEATAELQLKGVQKLVDRSSVITTVSTFTANLVKEKLDVRKKEIHVIHNGLNIPDKGVSRPTWAPKGKFLFSIGTFFKRKNVHVLVAMMKHLESYTLVLAGDHRRSYGEMVKEEITASGLDDRIYMPGEVSVSEKTWLYKNGEALLFPSLSEGFGIPLLEAMQHGTPVFSSCHGSLPEIGKDHAWYWDNFEPKGMADLVRAKLATKDESAKAARIAYAKEYSWRQTAAQYLDLYRKFKR